MDVKVVSPLQSMAFGKYAYRGCILLEVLKKLEYVMDMQMIKWGGALLLVSALNLYAGAAKNSEPELLSTSQNRFPLTLGNEVIEVQKVWNPVTKSVELISNSSNLRSPQELVRLEDNEKVAARKKNGALSPDLLDRFNSMADSDSVEVWIHPNVPRLPMMDKTLHTLSEVKEHARMNMEQLPYFSMETILRRHGLDSAPNQNPKSMGRSRDRHMLKISKRNLARLRFDPDITTIETKIDFAPLTQPFSSLAASAYNPTADIPSTWKGQGVNAATFEIGLAWHLQWSNGPQMGEFLSGGDIVTCANLNRANLMNTHTTIENNGGWVNGVWRQYYPISTWNNWEHSQQTFQCLRYAAPSANLYHLADANFNPQYNFSLIKNFGIQTISLSYGRGTGCGIEGVQYLTQPANTPEFMGMDQQALEYPYTLFCTPAGNQGHIYEVNWQNYNGLSVGNVKHKNLTHYEFSLGNHSTNYCEATGEATMSRNPRALYEGPEMIGMAYPYSYKAGDREMPSLVAPGTMPDGQSMSDPCVPQPITMGTSYSAPTLSGIAARVLSVRNNNTQNNAMTHWPEKVRAALLVTAQNVTGGEWDSNIDGWDGAGVVSGSEAINFALNFKPVTPGYTGVIDGLAAKIVYGDESFYQTESYNIKIPSAKKIGYHLRVVLVWDSNPLTTYSSNGPPIDDNRLSDLDLTVASATGTPSIGSRISASWNNSIEIVDVPSAQLQASGNYIATVHKLTNRIPAGSFFYYCIAWTWVRDHAL